MESLVWKCNHKIKLPLHVKLQRYIILIFQYTFSLSMANKHMKVENKGLGEDIFTKAFHSKPMNIKKEETVLNNSEVLLESFVEEGQSFIEEGKSFLK